MMYVYRVQVWMTTGASNDRLLIHKNVVKYRVTKNRTGCFVPLSMA
jgi:hypothetical protein